MDLMNYKEKNFYTYECLAEMFEVSPPTAYHWCIGKTLPTIKNMKRIIRATKGEVTKEDLISFYQSQKTS
jgi:DNA-binding transcriptional regulator YdaS (Cro superfamily)